jgi:hypothetical protein
MSILACELEAERALSLRKRLTFNIDDAYHGDAFQLCSTGPEGDGATVLYLNPPYDHSGPGVCPTPSSTPSGSLAVWVRHSPVNREQLPLLQGAARIAYGLSPEGPLRTFGPLSARSALLYVSAQPYSRAGHLAQSLAATRRATDKLVDAQLRAHRVPPLPSLGPTRGQRRTDRAAAERAWLRNALTRRVSPRAAFHVLARDSTRSAASAVTAARSALSALTAATPAALLSTVASSLSLPTSYLQAFTKPSASCAIFYEVRSRLDPTAAPPFRHAPPRTRRPGPCTSDRQQVAPETRAALLWTTLPVGREGERQGHPHGRRPFAHRRAHERPQPVSRRAGIPATGGTAWCRRARRGQRWGRTH